MSYQNLNLFLAVCEYENLHRAADHLLVSPQYLSHYISGLERQYGVRLFHRTPQLSLTYEGELLLEAAKDVQFYERNFESELQDLFARENSELHLGCGSQSIYMFLPQLLENYYKIYPNIRVVVSEYSEANSYTFLEDGKLDLYLGIHLEPRPQLELFPLSSEEVFLLLSDRLLRSCFPNDYPLCAGRFAHGLPLDALAEIPLLKNRSEGFLYRAMERQLVSRNILFHYAFVSGSTQALISLSRRGIGALVCTGRYLPLISHPGTEMDSFLYQFPILDFSCDYHLDIAYAKERHLPRYVTAFIICAQSLFKMEHTPERRTPNEPSQA